MHYILTVVLLFVHTYVVGIICFEIVIFDIFVHSSEGYIVHKYHPAV